MENQAVELVGRKTQAANLLYGNASGGGLSELASGGGGNLLSELAKSIQDDSKVTDLTALFARAAAAPVESAWLVAETAELTPIPVVETVEEQTPVAEPVSVAVSDMLMTVAPLPPRKPQRRKRARSLLDAPTDSPFSLPTPKHSSIRPVVPPARPAPIFDLTQLPLF